MKHIELYEAFGWDNKGASRLIIVEGTMDDIDPQVQEEIDDMQSHAELEIVDMSLCEEADVEVVAASNAKKVLFVNGDDCDRRIRYAVMDLHPEIIPAGSLTIDDLE